MVDEQLQDGKMAVEGCVVDGPEGVDVFYQFVVIRITTSTIIIAASGNVIGVRVRIMNCIHRAVVDVEEVPHRCSVAALDSSISDPQQVRIAQGKRGAPFFPGPFRILEALHAYVEVALEAAH